VITIERKSELSGLKNIGPTIEKKLNEVGIYTRQDREQVGAIETYRRIKAKYLSKTTPVRCYYYLYSLQGSLAGKHWDDLPQRE
jgi:DNA transformation protein